MKKRDARARKRQRALARRDASGRVHLRLHHDPSTGQEQVLLTTPVFKEEWQNHLLAAAANTARGILRDEPDLERTVALARNSMAATSRLAEGLLAQAPDGVVACRAGCDHCCYQVVGVTAPEALAIFDYLLGTRSPEQIASLSAHVAELYERGRGLSAGERFSPEYPCPFLDAGRCSIYEVRPLACRGMNSLDAGECETRLREPAARAAFLENGAGGRSFLEPIRAFHAISAGLQLALAELYRLDMQPLELTAVLHLLLSGDEQLGEAWLEGQQPFASARSGDKRNDPGMQAVSNVLNP